MVLTEYDILVAYLPQLVGLLITRPDGRTGVKVTAFTEQHRGQAHDIRRWINISLQSGRKLFSTSPYLAFEPKAYHVRQTAESLQQLPDLLLNAAHRLHARATIRHLPTLPPNLRRYLLARY